MKVDNGDQKSPIGRQRKRPLQFSQRWILSFEGQRSNSSRQGSNLSFKIDTSCMIWASFDFTHQLSLFSRPPHPLLSKLHSKVSRTVKYTLFWNTGCILYCITTVPLFHNSHLVAVAICKQPLSRLTLVVVTAVKIPFLAMILDIFICIDVRNLLLKWDLPARFGIYPCFVDSCRG